MSMRNDSTLSLRGEARPELFFRDGHVALADFLAVDLGQNRVRVLRVNRETGQERHRNSTGERGQGQAGALARLLGGRNVEHREFLNLKGACLGRRTVSQTTHFGNAKTLSKS
jgi:predicted ABC-class ATPase